MKKIMSGLIAILALAMIVSAAPQPDNPSIADEFNLPGWMHMDDPNDPLDHLVPYHTWRYLGNGQINGYQYDAEGTLLYVVHGVPGVAENMIQLPNGNHKFLIDSNNVPNNAKFKNGYVHFHPAAMQDNLSPGIEGYFLKHTAVTSGFEFPSGRLVEQQGVDFGFPNNYELI